MEQNEPIKPSRIILKQEQLSDSADGRAGYDSRIIAPNDLPDNLGYFKLLDYFRFNYDDRMDTEKSNKLKKIYEWAAKKSKTTEFSELVHTLRSLETRLGYPRYGTTFDQVYNYANLDLQIESLMKERETMYDAALRSI